MTESKFNECVRTQSKRLYLIALSFTKNQADAEDILQNVYLKLWNCKKEFESNEHMAKWLTKVCVNESKDLLRLHFRKRNVPLEDAVNLSHIDDTQDIDLIKAVMSLLQARILFLRLLCHCQKIKEPLYICFILKICK